MILAYFTSNFMTIMLIAALIVMMAVNKKVKIPATQMFYALIAVILVLSVLDFMDDFFAGRLDQKPAFDPILVRTVVDTFIYTLRPLVILIELLVIIPRRRNRILCTIPSVVNAAWYFTAPFGGRMAFYIDENNRWQGGLLSWQLVYAVQLLYVALLLVYSIDSFGHKNRKRGVILLMIFLMAASTAILEFENLLPGYSTTVAALCVLLYYIYLASIYQQEISETVQEKDLRIAEQELLLLRGQIDPVFISDSLGVIRALAKTDKKASVAAIDGFSVYLRAHMNTIRDDEPVSFSSELDCVKAYLALVRIREQKQMELRCKLQKTAFLLPPLTLEAIVEYALRSRQDDDKAVTIQTAEDGAAVHVCVSVSGTKKRPSSEPSGTEDGLENARRRLEMQCGGTIGIFESADEVLVKLTVPRSGIS